MTTLKKIARSLVLSLAAFVAQTGLSDWTYDPSASTITDGTSTLKVTAKGTDLTISTGHTAVGAVLDFSLPVTDSESTAYSIVGISASAFSGNTAITKVVYPDTLRTIGGQAFSGCTGITLVEPALVPEYVTSFNASNRGVYEGCSSITQTFRIGYVPITTGGGQWISGTGVIRAEFGPYIKTIPTYCFEVSSLKELVLSEGLETFQGGNSFGSITNIVNCMPTTLKTLNASPRGVKNIHYLMLTNVTTLGGNFAGSQVYKAWFGPDITSYPEYLFENWSGLTNITFCVTNAITKIGNYATFHRFWNVQEITFMGPAQTESVLNSIFANVTDLKPIVNVSKRQGGWTALSGLEQSTTTIREKLGSKAADYEHILSREDFVGLYTATGGKRVWFINKKSIYDGDEPEVAKSVQFYVEPVGVATVVPAVGAQDAKGGDEIAVSAPTWGTDGSTCYKLATWTLEHLAGGSWVQDSTGTERSFTLTVPTGDIETYRLRWTYATATDVSLLTFNHGGNEVIDISAEPLIASGRNKWYATGTAVTLTAHDVASAPKSVFQYWLADDTRVAGSVYNWDGAADLVLTPIYQRDWLVDTANKKLKSGAATLSMSISGTEISIGTGHTGVEGILDLSEPVYDADGNPYTIVTIGENAFAGNTAITKVVYPDTLRTIGGQAFAGCTGITLVEPALVPEFITSFNASNRGVYEGCSSITQTFRIGYVPITTGGGQWISGTGVIRAEFGPYIKTIPMYCFEHSSLRELVLSEGLETFQSGNSFSSITNLVNCMPSTLKTLYATLRYVKNIHYLKLENVKTLAGSFSGSQVYKAWFGPDITSYPDDLFERGNGITNVTFCVTNAITKIGNGSTFGDFGAIQEITFMGPAQTTNVLDKIFANVTDLKPIAYASRNQGGWTELDGLIVGQAAVEEELGSKAAAYEHIYKRGKFIGLYKTASGKRVWIVHRKSIYDPEFGLSIILR